MISIRESHVAVLSLASLAGAVACLHTASIVPKTLCFALEAVLISPLLSGIRWTNNEYSYWQYQSIVLPSIPWQTIQDPGWRP